MTGENGVPETPDWDISRVIRVTRAEFDWLMSDDDADPEWIERGTN